MYIPTYGQEVLHVGPVLPELQVALALLDGPVVGLRDQRGGPARGGLPGLAAEGDLRQRLFFRLIITITILNIITSRNYYSNNNNKKNNKKEETETASGAPARRRRGRPRAAQAAADSSLSETDIYTYPPINIYSIYFRTGVPYSKLIGVCGQILAVGSLATSRPPPFATSRRPRCAQREARCAQEAWRGRPI